MKPIVLLGSWALRSYIPGFRNPNDVDIVAYYDDIMPYCNHRGGVRSFYPTSGGKKIVAKLNSGTMLEAEVAWENSLSHELMQYVMSDKKSGVWESDGFKLYTPSLNVLYALKMSHRYLKDSPHFLKTMRDIQAMREHGAEIPADLQDWYNRRVKETYAYKHPNLMQNKANFFNGDGVPYVYDHDTIHEGVALFTMPAYRYYAADDSEVFSDKNKFFAMPRTIQLAGVYEESCVLALERSLIPAPGKLTPEEAFKLALMKVCTSITSGWFREFAWENYDAVIELYKDYPDYHERFKIALKKGIVKPYVASN